MTLAAGTYVTLILVLIGFQMCMAAGAPWGHLANGGRWPGRLPPAMRLAALGQASILGGMGMSMAVRGGLDLPWPGWTFWIALVMTLATTLANLVTPSAPERRLWGPVTVVMTLCAVWLAVAPPPA